MKWALQTLLLALVIYAFVRFVQATRGSRFVRGLFFAFVLSVALLWGLSTGLQLEELEHILQGATGFLVASLAIVFGAGSVLSGAQFAGLSLVALGAFTGGFLAVLFHLLAKRAQGLGVLGQGFHALGRRRRWFAEDVVQDPFAAFNGRSSRWIRS